MTTGKQLLIFGSMSATEQAYYEDKMTYRPSVYFWSQQFQQKNDPYGKQIMYKNEKKPYS